ncbi:hypothetical protein ACFL2J_06125 [Candidatus Omnitrophota bacterium]
MKIKSIILFLVLMLVFIGQADCDDSGQARLLFFKGNAYYNDGSFLEAVGQYEQVLKLGLESGPLYYNLANAYFKSGSLGKAMLNYLRAKRLSPKDADLISNLAYAQSLVKGGVVARERIWIGRMFYRLVDSFSLNKITLISMILYFILSILIIAFVLMRNCKKALSHASLAALALFIISASLFYTQYSRIVVQREAVVVSEKSDSRFEPFIDATTFFTLYEGEKVNMVTSEKGWIKIRRLDGKQGWIKESDIEFI